MKRPRVPLPLASVESADEALAAAQFAVPEVMVLDLGIDDVDTFIAALGPGVKVVKVILASGARGLPETASLLGAAYLLKPFAPEQLLAAIVERSRCPVRPEAADRSDLALGGPAWRAAP